MYETEGTDQQRLFSRLFKPATFNLIIGSPKSGRTKLALTNLNSYRAGSGFLDHHLAPKEKLLQMAAISATGTSDELKSTIRDLELAHLNDFHNFPIRDWDDSQDEDWRGTLSRLLKEMEEEEAAGPIKFLFIRGLQNMMPSGRVNDFKLASKFCRELKEFCVERSLIILATVGTAKQKHIERYSQLADRIFGASVWAEWASTLIGIERLNLERMEEEREPGRRIVIQSHNYEVVLDGEWCEDTGRLIVVDRQTLLDEAPSFAMMDRVWDSSVTCGAVLDRQQVVELAEWPLSYSTMGRWLRRRSHDKMGFVEKVGKGKYRKPLATIN